MSQESRYKIHRQAGANVMPIHIGIGARNIRVGPNAGPTEMKEAFKELANDLNAYFKQLTDFLPEDLAEALEPTLDLSKEYCPVDTGKLVGSAYLAKESFRGGARVEIGYARNGDPDYAVIVHEQVHVGHAPPTSAKFLQRAIDEDYYNILQRVTDRVKARSGAF